MQHWLFVVPQGEAVLHQLKDRTFGHRSNGHSPKADGGMMLFQAPSNAADSFCAYLGQFYTGKSC